MSSVAFGVRRRDLAWVIATFMLISAVWIARSDMADAETAPAGTGIDVVYIAVGTGFPDALGVGPGAAVNGAPVIIVPTNPPLDPATATELIRLDPRKVIIIGGTGVVSASMETTIAALLPNAVIARIAGGNRYQTNAAFSAATFPVESWASVSGAAFSAILPATDDVHADGGLAYNNTSGVLVAPIQLPHGAKILEFVLLGNDSDSDRNCSASLRRADHSTGREDIATVQTSGNPGDLTVSTESIDANRAIVDNQHYGYDVVFVAGAFEGDTNCSVGTVMVRYSLGTPGA